MFSLKIKPSFGSAVDQIKLEAIKEDILVLANNAYRMIVETSSFNFELMSEIEQDNLIENYQGFLNSIGSSFQILIRTRELDLENYFNDLKIAQHTNQTANLDELIKYQEFVKGLVQVNHILSRNFYIIIPLNFDHPVDFKLVSEQLRFKVDLITKSLKKIGMQSHLLTSLDILNLFYSYYCPETAKMQPINQLIFKNAPFIL